ncbi:regulatory protein, luxR family [Microbacterium sp. cf046]|uniref:helix-turn-helix transcriptional regulator n=1 Tax=Microbacterium sp. cf046 TaxID=1761803 RepID=UPI0008E84B22|nr:helix-turn-helix transcriptional regulator [Microbacterium sp. cf046]SFS07152.1 regulatory protein, luxR family [Microbacterium sp. cf046]
MATGEVTNGRAASRRLIGRQSELARLESLLKHAIEAPHAQTAFVEGEAGMGKTRIVMEFASRAEALGANVLVGRCVLHGELILPYAPLVEVLTDLVRQRGVAGVVELAAPNAPELARWIPALDDAVSVPELNRASANRLFRAVRAIVDGLSKGSPVVIIIEDLQWADQSTVELMAILSSQLRGGTLLLFTVRSDETSAEPEVARFIAEAGRGSDRRVVLQPLTREEQALQLSDILGVPPRKALLDDVYARAEGNPFFAEELLALARDGDLPATVRDLLLARLEALSPATRQVLRAACVIGRRVTHRLLEQVADRSGPSLDAALRPAVEQHVLLTEQAGGLYMFRHALLQEAIAGGLLPGEAARLHERAAAALTESPELAGTAGAAAGAIARHWDAAGDRPRALTSSVAAAREAARALAFSESLSHYDRAIALLEVVRDGDELLDEPRYRLLWAAAEVAHLAGRPERAAELIRAAIDAVDPAERHHHGYLHERLGRYLWMAADGVGALAAYQRAVELVPAEPETSWRAAVLSGYSQVLMLGGRFEESAALAEEAIRIAQTVPNARSIEGHARNNLGVDLAHVGSVDEGIVQLLLARDIAEEQFDDLDDIARAVVNLQSILFDADRIEEAAVVAIEGIAVVDGLGLQQRKGVWARCDAAEALLRLGRYPEAELLLDEAATFEPLGIDALRADLTRGQLHFRRGALAEADALLERAARNGARLLDGQLIGPLYATWIEVAVARGELDAAVAAAHTAQLALSDEEPAIYAVPVFVAAAAAAAARSRVDASHARDAGSVREWVELAAAALARDAAAVPTTLATYAGALCELAESEGRECAAEWVDAAEQWARVKDPFREAQMRLRAAEALLALGDRRAAAAQVRAAAVTSADIGAQQLMRMANRIAKHARVVLGDEPKPDADLYQLTPREREVLALVAEGLTDRTIGSRLYISHRTVERHVSNLLAKLDAGRRAELTAIAHRHGLVI